MLGRSLIVPSLWFWTLVFVALCCVTFQVFCYLMSWPLSSQLLRRNHVIYFSSCHMAPRTVVATVKHARTQDNTASRPPIPVCGQDQDVAGLAALRPEVVADGKEQFLVNAEGRAFSASAALAESSVWGALGQWRGIEGTDPLCNRHLSSSFTALFSPRVIRPKAELKFHRKKWVK